MAYKITVTVLAILFLCASCFFGYQYYVVCGTLNKTKSDLDRWIDRCIGYIAITKQLRCDIANSEKRLADMESASDIIRDRANSLEKRISDALSINNELERIAKQ